MQKGLCSQTGKLSFIQIPGEGETTIYNGTECAIFLDAFIRAEKKFWGIISAKVTSRVVINFGISFRKITSEGIDFDQISLTWSLSQF